MIVVKNLNKDLSIKQYGKGAVSETKHVLKDISFHIAPNEFVAVIGKNGAGKTTLLNILSGIWKADSGFVRINGCKDTLQDFEALRKILYVSGNKSQLWADLKLKYSFENCAKMYGLDKERYSNRLKDLTEIFDIKDLLENTVDTLSLGEKIRCELVYGLLPEPEVLFLDEAMIGLDVSVKEKVMDLFRKLKSENKTTLIYTSHNLTEVERICDRIILLDNGRIIYDGEIEMLMNDYAPEYQVIFDICGNIPDLEDLPVERYEINGDILSIWFNKQKIESATIIRHITKRCNVRDVNLNEPNLEDTIKKIYRIS